MNIGILALQGAFLEHRQVLESMGITCVEVRQKKDLKELDGIILPGGESTVQGKLLHQLDMFDVLQEKIQKGLPTLATCAGLILLAQSLEEDETKHLQTLPVTVRRNAYGRQLGSFVVEAECKGMGDIPMVFIRAPYITKVEEDVEVLAEVEGNIVAVRYKNQLGLSFHPELTENRKIFETFLSMCQTS